MSRAKQNARCMVVGSSGYGKSYLIKRTILPGRDRVLVVDPQGEYAAQVDAVAVRPAEAKRWLQARGAAHYLAPFRLACVPSSEADAVAFLRLAWTLPDSLVLLEEIDTYSSSHSTPPELRQLVQRGRHRRIDVLSASQEPKSTPKVVRSLADVIVAFRLSDPLDVRAVKHRISAPPDRLYDLKVGEYEIGGNPRVARHFGLPAPT